MVLHIYHSQLTKFIHRLIGHWGPLLGCAPRLSFVSRIPINIAYYIFIFIHLQQIPKGDKGQIEMVEMPILKERGPL